MSAETDVKALGLTADPKRADLHGNTGIYIRAKRDGEWGAYDMAELDRASLFKWMRCRGGKNVWAENIVFTLMGHEPVSEADEP